MATHSTPAFTADDMLDLPLPNGVWPDGSVPADRRRAVER